MASRNYAVFISNIKGYDFPEELEKDEDNPWYLIKKSYNNSMLIETINKFKTYDEALKEYKKYLKTVEKE